MFWSQDVFSSVHESVSLNVSSTNEKTKKNHKSFFKTVKTNCINLKSAKYQYKIVSFYEKNLIATGLSKATLSTQNLPISINIQSVFYIKNCKVVS